ncbi:MAG: 1,4-dihydroxy-6-naphthoate synthase [Fimbriimonadaceae bacterium]|nr:1,4-dihydroxy-6-naphthoate synthase [Chitinophagales bacterium]
MKLTLGYSPCPNDAFIFDAIANKKIDTEGFEFDVMLEDVETLNEMALHETLDISKLSYHAYAYVSEKYILLTSGSALGRGCGPLLISKYKIPQTKIEYCVIGIPGKLTTANLLLSVAFPEALTKKGLIFSKIEDALLKDEIDAGVIIHENRFTFEKKGLQKIIDLGEYWENKYKLPIPLGGIAIKRNFDIDTQKRINRIVRNSVEFALQNPAQTMNYVKEHAQEMETSVMQQHIELYVNDFTVDLGEEGKNAVEKLYTIAQSKKIIPSVRYPLFVQ